MAYTEVKIQNGRKNFYRVLSVRKGKKVGKKRIFLGPELTKKELKEKEGEADRELGLLESLLTLDQLKVLKKLKTGYSNQPKENFENRYEAFCSRFTHDSTAIEGNTLSLQETASLLFENLVPGGKHLRELNEVLNHKRGFDLTLNHQGDVSRTLILLLHHLVVEDTLEPHLKDQIGVFRTVQVYISGLDWMPPAPKDVPTDMKQLLTWYSKNKKKLHPLVQAVYFHCGFETIHPFIDGNGRVGRLLMNFILHKNGYPMINIPVTRRWAYYDALESARKDGDLKPFLELMIELMIKNTLLF